MTLPPVHRVRRADTRRLIPSKYLDKGDSVLTLIADSPEHLEAIFELDAATNDRLRAEAGGVPGIAARRAAGRRAARGGRQRHLLSSRIRSARASTGRRAAHGTRRSRSKRRRPRSPSTSRSSWPRSDRRTSPSPTTSTSPTSTPSSTICGARRRFRACLAPDSYIASQALAETLLDRGSLGVVFPSVRHKGGTCVACFRPALVTNVRRSRRWRFTWQGGGPPAISRD